MLRNCTPICETITLDCAQHMDANIGKINKSETNIHNVLVVRSTFFSKYFTKVPKIRTGPKEIAALSAKRNKAKKIRKNPTDFHNTIHKLLLFVSFCCSIFHKLVNLSKRFRQSSFSEMGPKSSCVRSTFDPISNNGLRYVINILDIGFAVSS